MPQGVRVPCRGRGAASRETPLLLPSGVPSVSASAPDVGSGRGIPRQSQAWPAGKSRSLQLSELMARLRAACHVYISRGPCGRAHSIDWRSRGYRTRISSRLKITARCSGKVVPLRTKFHFYRRQQSAGLMWRLLPRGWLPGGCGGGRSPSDGTRSRQPWRWIGGEGVVFSMFSRQHSVGSFLTTRQAAVLCLHFLPPPGIGRGGGVGPGSGCGSDTALPQEAGGPGAPVQGSLPSFRAGRVQ